MKIACKCGTGVFPSAPAIKHVQEPLACGKKEMKMPPEGTNMKELGIKRKAAGGHSGWWSNFLPGKRFVHARVAESS